MIDNIFDILAVFIATLTLFVGSLIGVLWKFVIKRINKNEEKLEEVEKCIYEQVKSMESQRRRDYDQIKEFIKKTYSLGSEESEMLIRIDERVNDIRNDLNEVKTQVDELYKTNGNGGFKK